MTLTWTREDSPRWDGDKQRLFGPAELAALGLAPPAPEQPAPGRNPVNRVACAPVS